MEMTDHAVLGRPIGCALVGDEYRRVPVYAAGVTGVLKAADVLGGRVVFGFEELDVMATGRDVIAIVEDLRGVRFVIAKRGTL